jgi:hypothetical protein
MPKKDSELSEVAACLSNKICEQQRYNGRGFELLFCLRALRSPL